MWQRVLHDHYRCNDDGFERDKYIGGPLNFHPELDRRYHNELDRYVIERWQHPHCHGAGTLSNPFNQMFTAFKQDNPGVTINSHFGASGDDVKDITQLGQPVDVLGVADYSLIPKNMFSVNGKSFASWYVGFVSNEITLAYTANSKGAAQLTPSNWYKIVAQSGVRIGRSNPAADPSGYQFLQMLELANTYYKDPTLSASGPEELTELGRGRD